ncbi:hypothetical protein JHU38_01395 [Prevotella sp. A2931]|uniref:Uncharacterized protein n=2 Tax=Prevotellaceae TaxID=171552 RepID=A0ABS3M2S2_9BACT|nr:hypothetical protein [Prevotella illustrans]PTL25038.1 hypothetical protein C3V39_09945 [Prevotella sp. oral taxon 820]
MVAGNGIFAFEAVGDGCGLDSEMTEAQIDFLAEMMPLNIEARYPSYKEQLAKALSPERCREMISKTNEMKLWINRKL